MPPAGRLILTRRRRELRQAEVVAVKPARVRRLVRVAAQRAHRREVAAHHRLAQPLVHPPVARAGAGEDGDRRDEARGVSAALAPDAQPEAAAALFGAARDRERQYQATAFCHTVAPNGARESDAGSAAAGVRRASVARPAVWTRSL